MGRTLIWLLAAVTLAACGQRVASQHAAVLPAELSPAAASPGLAPATPSPSPTAATPASTPAEEGATPTPATSPSHDSAARPGGHGEESPDRHGSELWGRSFTSVAVTEAGQPKTLVPGTSIRVEFERRDDGGGVRWSAGCNTYGAWVVISADRLDLEAESLGGTAMGCDEERHEQDGWTNGFFSADPHWRLEGDRLVLTVDDDVIELRETEPGSDGS